MAESCKERYAVHHYSPEMLHRVSGAVRAFVDVDEMGDRKGHPLTEVMDFLGYKGDRSGLVPTSCVEDVSVVGDAVHFTVRDNFSPFDICRSLAEHMDTVFAVDALYQVDEAPDFGIISDVQHFEAASLRFMRNDLSNNIKLTVDILNSQDGQDINYIESFAAFPMGEGKSVMGFTPESALLYSESEGFVSLPFVDCDAVSLEMIRDYMKRNDEFLFGKGYQNLRFDVLKARERLLYEMYGSSSAYGAVSEYMKGFDVVYVPSERKIITAEAAKRIAFNAVSFDPAKTFGTLCDYLDHGYDAEIALKRAGVRPPVEFSPERMQFVYDGKMLCSFRNESRGDSPLHADDWRLDAFDEANVESFKDFCGVDLKKEVIDVDDSMYASVSFKGKFVADLARRCMLTPENLVAKRQAENVCSRKATQREFYERYVKPSGEQKGQGLHIK